MRAHEQKMTKKKEEKDEGTHLGDHVLGLEKGLPAGLGPDAFLPLGAQLAATAPPAARGVVCCRGGGQLATIVGLEQIAPQHCTHEK